MRKILGFVTLMLLCYSVNAADRYLLNSGDILSISVWNEDALQKDVIILPDGMISFPLVGELSAEGGTVSELQTAITEKLKQYLADPVVTVSVNSVGGNSIHIMGKVTSPGSIVMSQPLDFMQALSLAGGLSPYAKEGEIIVLRRDTDGNQEVISVDYPAIKKGKSLDTNIMLKSGDVIIIP